LHVAERGCRNIEEPCGADPHELLLEFLPRVVRRCYQNEPELLWLPTMRPPKRVAETPIVVGE
jgi:hypothetical protein